MTARQFTRCLDLIGWTLRGAADRLGLPPTRIRRWADGDYPVPDEVAQWLQVLANAHRNNPAPEID